MQHPQQCTQGIAYHIVCFHGSQLENALYTLKGHKDRWIGTRRTAPKGHDKNQNHRHNRQTSVTPPPYPSDPAMQYTSQQRPEKYSQTHEQSDLFQRTAVYIQIKFI